MISSSKGLGPEKTALAGASSIYKRQTRPLVREGAPQKQDRKYQTVKNIWSWAPDGARHQDLLTDWPSVAMDFDFDFYLIIYASLKVFFSSSWVGIVIEKFLSFLT
jgi:hypothetical protein